MIYVILSTLLFGLTLFFIKLSAVKISPLIGSAVFGASSLIIQMIVIFVSKYQGNKFNITAEGVRISIFGGVILGAYTVLLFLAFSKMGITKVTPTVYVGAILISSLLGILFLGEKMNYINMIGIFLALSGLTLLFVK
ncbi:MAG: EamA family transporter [bacterium]